MAKTALVLSGGGAKGAFQVGAERYAREVKGYRWDVISGVSVGALNGAMLAMRSYDRILELWLSMTTEKILGPQDRWRILRRMLIGKRPSLFPIRGLKDIVDNEIDERRICIDFRFGAVSLVTGEFHLFRPGDAGFSQALLASAAVPLFFPPVKVSELLPAMVDGGVRSVSPIGAVFDADPEHIVIINCNPLRSSQMVSPPQGFLQICQRSFDIALNEIFTNDIGKFRRINRLVEQAQQHGITLYRESGGPFRRYPYTIIEPDEILGDTMDFSPEHIRRCMEAGWEKAKKVLT